MPNQWEEELLGHWKFGNFNNAVNFISKLLKEAREESNISICSEHHKLQDDCIRCFPTTDKVINQIRQQERERIITIIDGMFIKSKLHLGQDYETVRSHNAVLEELKSNLQKNI